MSEVLGKIHFWSTFVGVTTILEEEYENIIKILANKFIKDYGAPNLQIALPVAKEEIEFMNSICEEHPDNTLLMVSREFTAKGIREKFRHIQANDAELEAFAIHGSTEWDNEYSRWNWCNWLIMSFTSS